MPQQKKTAPIEAAALPDISAEDQEFARLVALGRGSLSDAYRQTHDCASWLANSVWCAASKLRSSAKVQQWIDAFRAAGLGAAGYTLERHVAELERLKALSVASGNMGAALGCEQTIGKASGLHVEQVHVTQRTGEPADMLRELAQVSPSTAAALAKEHGIDLPDMGVTRH